MNPDLKYDHPALSIHLSWRNACFRIVQAAKLGNDTAEPLANTQSLWAGGKKIS